MKIEVIKVDPLKLPAHIVWQISGLYHITQKDFIVYVEDKANIIYVNKSVPEKDIADFIKVVTSPECYVLDDTTEIGKYMEYVYEKYGFAAYKALLDAHKWRIKQQDKENAKEKIQSIIPTIEKMIGAGLFDENMIYEAHSAGYEVKGKTPENICSFCTVYTYCLGYLVGKGVLKEDYSPKSGKNVIDYYCEIIEMLESIDTHEMPRIYDHLKEMYFTEESEA